MGKFQKYFNYFNMRSGRFPLKIKQDETLIIMACTLGSDSRDWILEPA